MRIHASRVEIYEPATVCPRDTRGMTSSLGQSTIVMAQLRSDLSLVMTSWVFLIIVTMIDDDGTCEFRNGVHQGWQLTLAHFVTINSILINLYMGRAIRW